MSKRFHLSDVLTVVTGRLVSSRGMEGVYDILNYLTGASVYTHQIPEALGLCRPVVVRQYPALDEVEVNCGTTEGSVKVWVDEQIKQYGEYLLLEADHSLAVSDPLASLVKMRINPNTEEIAPIVVVQLGEDHA